MDTKGARILQQLDVRNSINFPSLLNICPMSSNSQTHQIFSDSKFLSKPNINK